LYFTLNNAIKSLFKTILKNLTTKNPFVNQMDSVYILKVGEIFFEMFKTIACGDTAV
jgi:hypothetical protein